MGPRFPLENLNDFIQDKENEKGKKQKIIGGRSHLAGIRPCALDPAFLKCSTNSTKGICLELSFSVHFSACVLVGGERARAQGLESISITHIPGVFRNLEGCGLPWLEKLAGSLPVLPRLKGQKCPQPPCGCYTYKGCAMTGSGNKSK